MVFMLHDINDIFLELAKSGRYARLPVLPNLAFAIFLLTWIVTRLAIFPNWVIRSTLFDTLVRVWASGVLRSSSSLGAGTPKPICCAPVRPTLAVCLPCGDCRAQAAGLVVMVV